LKPERNKITARNRKRSDHCPAMKGIETLVGFQKPVQDPIGSDHCPAMKGIETGRGGGLEG